MHILQDETGKKTSLAVKYYTHYNFTIGEQINCRLDKINCAGKIYFEPDPPFYKIGKDYFFKFLYFDDRTEKKSCKTISVMIVEDIYKLECTVMPGIWQNDINFNPKFIKCKVLKISKGRLILEFIEIQR